MDVGNFVKFTTGSFNQIKHYGLILKVNKKTYKIRFVWANGTIEKNIKKENVICDIPKDDYYYWEDKLGYNLCSLPFNEAIKSLAELPYIN
tara:strand:- start:502 stop:774 length:273 start_codon:yes stop_codon:yes gene_type:complete